MRVDLKESIEKIKIAQVGIDINKFRIQSSTSDKYKYFKRWENAKLNLLLNNRDFKLTKLSGIIGEALFWSSISELNIPGIRIATGDQDLKEHTDFFISDDIAIDTTTNIGSNTLYKTGMGSVTTVFLPQNVGQDTVLQVNGEITSYQWLAINTNQFDPFQFITDTININKDVLSLYRESQQTGIKLYRRDASFEEPFVVGDISDEQIENLDSVLNILQNHLLSNL